MTFPQTPVPAGRWPRRPAWRAATTLDGVPERSGGLQVTAFGIPIRLPWGGIVGVLLIAYLWVPAFDTDVGSGVLPAIVFATLLYAGVLLHEAAHAAAARYFGFPVREITLWLLGGYTVYERRHAHPASEAVISAAGPVTTLVIAGLCWGIALPASGMMRLVFAALAWSNLLLAVVNLLPGAPLDGGGIVKALVWRITGSESRGAVAAAYAGMVIAFGLTVISGYSLLTGSGQLLVGVIVLAGFIGFGAYQSLRSAKVTAALDRTSVLQLLRPILAVRDTDALDAVLARLDGTHAAAVTVNADGVLLAKLSSDAIAAVPPERRDSVVVGPFTIPVPAQDRVYVDDDLSAAVATLAASEASAAIAVDVDGRPVGALLATDVNRALGS